MSFFNPNDFETLGFISKGDQPVLRVRSKLSKQMFAMKKTTRQDLRSHLKDIQAMLRVMSCEHENVVKVVGFSTMQNKDSFRQEWDLLILMEIFDRTLESDIAERRRQKTAYSKDEILSLISQLISVLFYLQTEAEVAHRDIKPSNILLTSSNSILLTDFTESFLPSISQPRPRDLAGTPAYLSPELKELYLNAGFKEGSEYDPWRSDVYSMGLTVMECASVGFALEKAEIRDKLDYVQKVYGRELMDLFAIFLEKDDKKRLDFAGIRVSMEYLRLFPDGKDYKSEEEIQESSEYSHGKQVSFQLAEIYNELRQSGFLSKNEASSFDEVLKKVRKMEEESLEIAEFLEEKDTPLSTAFIDSLF